MLKFLKFHLFCLPMIATLCFIDLFFYRIILHRKWVRLKCVLKLLLDALLLCFNSYIYESIIKITEPILMAIKKALLGDNSIFLFLFFLFCWVLEVIATVITSPYQFLFRFFAKSSLWLRVSFIWEICNHVSVSGTSREKSQKITRMSFLAANLRASSPGNCRTFISSKFFELCSVTIF